MRCPSPTSCLEDRKENMVHTQIGRSNYQTHLHRIAFNATTLISYIHIYTEMRDLLAFRLAVIFIMFAI